MAVLLGRSACHLYCRYLSTAAKRTHLLVPTAISSVRQFSSPHVVNTIQTPSCDDQLAIKNILSELGSLRVELESLRKANENCKDQESRSPQEEKFVVAKEKHPLLKEIEETMFKAEFCSPADMLSDELQVECDKPGVAKVTLKKAYKKEMINIQVFTPCYDNEYSDPPFEMEVIVKVGFSRIFSSTGAEFHCTATDGELVIKKIKDPRDGPDGAGVIFELLPESLQRQLYEYLEIRGINDGTTVMLHNYMVDKMKRENMRGLGKLKKLVENA